MPKPWDETLRRLIRTNPEAFVRLIMPQAQFVRLRPEKLELEEVEVDAFVEITL